MAENRRQKTEESFQDDFFGEEFGEKKPKRSRLLELYSKQRFLPHLRIPTEYSVIIAIGVLVLIFLSYAVGVERGKRLRLAAKDITPIKEIEEKIKYAESLSELKTKEEPIRVEEATVKEDKQKEAEEEPAAQVKAKGTEKAAYIIQLASYAKEDAARNEVDKIKKKGINAKVEKKGKWYQLYVGGYYSIDEAKKAQGRLIKEYKDCYIRKIK